MVAITRQPPVMLGRDQFPLFKRLSVETTSHCNRSCSFCPVSTGRRDFASVSMDDALFEKIVAELEGLRWGGVLQLFLLNEPLLDRKLRARLSAIRDRVPRATVYLSTNGDPVAPPGRDAAWSVERMLELYDAGATTINVNVYDAGPEQAGRYGALVDALVATGRVWRTSHKYNAKPRGTKWIALTDMRPERLSSSVVDMFHRRTQEERSRSGAKGGHCARTQRHLVITYEGKVPVCCAVDPTHPDTPIMGDVRSSSLVEVWNSEQLFRYRFHTQRGLRDLPACDTCSHRMAYPHLVRQVTAPPETLERWRAQLEESATPTAGAAT